MKRKIIQYTLPLLVAAFAYTGCYYDKASLVYPSEDDCDTTDITLSTDINAILTANCFVCHGGNATAANGIQLEQYAVIKAYADNGRLLSAITQDGNAAPMPQGAAKLSDCNINKFRAWINAGAPNN
jgi:mono/diheme cytochrome c family protein